MLIGPLQAHAEHPTAQMPAARDRHRPGDAARARSSGLSAAPPSGRDSEPDDGGQEQGCDEQSQKQIGIVRQAADRGHSITGVPLISHMARFLARWLRRLESIATTGAAPPSVEPRTTDDRVSGI